MTTDLYPSTPASFTASAEQARPARAAAYLLGGRGHTQADRTFAEGLVARWPRWTSDLRASEAYLTDAVRTLRGDSVDQVIDLSPALPTPDGPYSAFGAGAGVRLVRVDGDPVTAAQTAALVHGTPHRVVERDPDTPDAAMEMIRRRRLLDLRRPVVLLAGLGALESRPAGSVLERMLAGWGRELPAGSVLVFTHDSDDARTPTEVVAARRARARYAQIGAVFTARSEATVSMALRNTGWVLTQPLTWAARGHAPAHGTAGGFPGQPDGRVASVLAGIAVHQSRHRAPAGHRGRTPDSPAPRQPAQPTAAHIAGRRR